MTLLVMVYFYIYFRCIKSYIFNIKKGQRANKPTKPNPTQQRANKSTKPTHQPPTHTHPNTGPNTNVLHIYIFHISYFQIILTLSFFISVLSFFDVNIIYTYIVLRWTYTDFVLFSCPSSSRPTLVTHSLTVLAY